MDFTRLQNKIDTDRMQARTLAIVGLGGGANLARNVVRCGIGGIKLFDRDVVGAENLCRQEHLSDQVGLPKVLAVANELQRINPAVRIETFARDFCTLSDAEADEYLGDVDLLIVAVDNLPANAKGNEVCLRLGKPCLWIGLYLQGRAGEVAFWYPGLRSCYRDLFPTRYDAHARGQLLTDPNTL
jgi:molybdopterin/thiamine biosynthesis adenylyltransferase